MRAAVPAVLPVVVAAALAAALSGCRAIDGLDDGLHFDRSLDGGSCVVAGEDCRAPLPEGWSGPVAIYEGPPSGIPTCPGAYPSPAGEGQRGVLPSSTQCSPCTCGAPTVSCTPGALTVYDKTTCHGSTAMVTPAAGTCTAVPGTPGMANGFEQVDPKLTSSCTPSGGALGMLPLTWTTGGIACALSKAPAGCADGSVCGPPPPSPFLPGWCIWRSGAATCPASFPVSHVWETADDQRGCTACACGSAMQTCSVTTQLFTDPACQTSPVGVGASGVCIQATSVQSAISTVILSGPATCPASGGSPTGSVTTATAATICCPAP